MSDSGIGKILLALLAGMLIGGTCIYLSVHPEILVNLGSYAIDNQIIETLSTCFCLGGA